jgi:hypothetical protein
VPVAAQGHQCSYACVWCPQEVQKAYEGAWDAEGYVEPEVKVIAVTAEEVELQEMNKIHTAIQRL